ncbi:sarcosine oxidase subunit alpha [Stella humosa]|uniref:Sarcosine oxidase subunit alpha n=1 Tax=Stella humosa TaxID=94 RepID=A0A3N1M7K0_9PROT|nr:sarcosine oxidase subunit alpha family protein [Stella humosa]ROQ01802.1 sarcosine oxidase subunit alpha [Stella humosa]BBK32189.1 sarcosine oxidase subunit alpha [Stella humosa]
MSGFRLPQGGAIDRDRRLDFTFAGRSHSGHPGDTLASALIASGVSVVARSFKYHRPRGIYSAGVEEPSALVQLGRGAWSEPNIRATQVELYQGLEAAPVNAWPGLGFDLGAVNQFLAPLLVAGFYYKTFLGPRGWWRRVYEPAIRRMAGMGRAPTEADPDFYDHTHVHSDLLVVGAGPAGLAAARAAASAGLRVILADDGREPGGDLLVAGGTIDGLPAAAWAARAADELRAMPEVTLLARTTVLGLYDHGYAVAVERRTDHLPPGSAAGHVRQRMWHVRAARTIVAAGAHERPLLFGGNDRPGVMLAGAVATYARRFGVACGRQAVFVTNNDSAYAAAAVLADAGGAIAAIVDLRPDGSPAAAALAARGIEVLNGRLPVAVHGGRAVTAIDIRANDGGTLSGSLRRIDCDLVAISGGWNPAVHLLGQLRGQLAYDEALACFRPSSTPAGLTVAGAAAGDFDLAGCLRGGHEAGEAAVAAAGRRGRVAMPVAAAAPAGAPILSFWGVAEGERVRGKVFVDLQNDVTVPDIELAAREGFRSIEHVKRYTTAGMGTDQGKSGNVNTIAVLSRALARPMGETGTTTYRAPYVPVAYGALAGRHVGALFDPERITPIHPSHLAAHAVFENVGQWKRPRYFPRNGEDMERAVLRECATVRQAVGMMDASTLGKIEVRGPDAAAFLDRFYINPMASLAVGACRYGVMCREDGMVFDDGVVMRLAPDRFFLTTTTGGAARVLDWMEEWHQTEWPELRVFSTSVTEQWVTVAVAGPSARALLGRLMPDVDLSAAAFPFMTFRDGVVAGMPARIARVSFSGELAFEISVEGTLGLALWEAVAAAGEPLGIAPYGTEAMHVLRAEKGYFIVGHETDGTVTPIDLGLERMVAKKKDFLGKRSLARSDTARPGRKQLVALLPEDPQTLLTEGAQIVGEPVLRTPMPMLGHVTSSYQSAAMGRTFALALVRDGRARIGELVYAPLVKPASGDLMVAARIADPVLFDPAGERRDG